MKTKFPRRWVLATTAIVFASFVLGACSGKVSPAISAGLDACAQCNMVIDTMNQACGYVNNREFVTFDSPGCLLKSYDVLRRQSGDVSTEIYFADYGSAELVRAEHAVFLLTEHIPTVMDSGVLCFATSDGALASRAREDEEITDWVGYRRLRGQPDTIVEAAITSDGLVPEIIEASKGDLVLFKIDGSQLHEEITISVRGYPEIAEVVVTNSGQPTELRFYAIRPGAGFPVIGVDNQVIGMIRVAGAHTIDEETL